MLFALCYPVCGKDTTSAGVSEEEIIPTLLCWQSESESSEFPCHGVSKILSYKYFAVLNNLGVNSLKSRHRHISIFKPSVLSGPERLMIFLAVVISNKQ